MKANHRILFYFTSPIFTTETSSSLIRANLEGRVCVRKVESACQQLTDMSIHKGMITEVSPEVDKWQNEHHTIVIKLCPFCPHIVLWHIRTKHAEFKYNSAVLLASFWPRIFSQSYVFCIIKSAKQNLEDFEDFIVKSKCSMFLPCRILCSSIIFQAWSSGNISFVSTLPAIPCPTCNSTQVTTPYFF